MNYDKIASGNSGPKHPGMENLTPWPKGVSGNPSGRPHKSLLQKQLEECANDEDFVARWIAAAKDRSMAPGVAGFLMSREILDRVDGPVKQEMDVNVTLGLAETLSKARQRLEE
jgi:hypothetical protein